MHWGGIVSGSAGVWSFASEWISCVNCLPQANYAVPVITDGGWGFGPRQQAHTQTDSIMRIYRYVFLYECKSFRHLYIQVENKKRSVLIRRLCEPVEMICHTPHAQFRSRHIWCILMRMPFLRLKACELWGQWLIDWLNLNEVRH